LLVDSNFNYKHKNGSHLEGPLKRVFKYCLWTRLVLEWNLSCWSDCVSFFRYWVY